MSASGAAFGGVDGGAAGTPGGAGPWRASAPGKVILLGEHAVVHGEPALAAAIPRRISVELTRDPRGPSIDLRVAHQPRLPSGLGLSQPPGAQAVDAVAAPAELTQAFAALCAAAGMPDARWHAAATSELPLGGGLGSSAALGVALARALRLASGRGCPPGEAAQIALALEQVFHGAPSGVDPAACAGEGLILFTRGAGSVAPLVAPVQPARPLELVIALTGISRGTRAKVLPLRDRLEARPGLYRPLLAALGELARGGARAAEAGDLVDLGVRFDAAHGLLAALGVSCPELEEVVAALRAAGALGAKLTGAGGGGAAIGLCRDAGEAERIAAGLREKRLEAFAVSIGGAQTAAVEADRGALPASAPRRGTNRRAGALATATAVAHANIALVKYWGKRDDALLLPEAGSLSLALDKLRTTTTVVLGADADSLLLDGRPAAPKELQRARALLDAAGISQRARIESRNEFPTGAGLASSASGFAALAVAACAAAGLEQTEEELSALARLGSGSAARSVPGGWAVWRDQAAEQVHPPDWFEVRMVVAVCAAGPKEVGSRDGMKSSRETSPYHRAWIAQCREDLPRALAFLAARDLAGLGALAESNALRMHADALAAAPPILYWQPATVGCLHALARLRAGGVQAWGTIDAGPHVVALCFPGDAVAVAAALQAVPGVVETLECAPAGGARVIAGPGAEA